MGSYVTATKGDCVISIAAAAGFANYKTVYDAAENADLRKLRPDPHILVEGGTQKLEWTIDIGGLDPIDTISGVQCRLNNLGYSTGKDATGTHGPGTTHAVRDFQNDNGLPVTGEIDDAFRKKLQEEHHS